MEAAVVGLDDPEWGERVCAFVARRPGAAAAATDAAVLKAWCRERPAGPKVPRDVFLEALPRNPTGKVLKRDLRGDFQGKGSCADLDAEAPSGVEVLGPR